MPTRRFPKSPRRVSRDGMTRRDALRAMGRAAGAVSLAPAMHACSDATNPGALAPEELDIETVVFVMMENRSFDHYFGALSLQENRPVDGLRPGMGNPRPDGSTVMPFRMDARCIEDPPHGWSSSHRQVNDGRNDGFVTEHHARAEARGFAPGTGDEVMGFHDRSQLPFLYSLADEFALCDRWFSSVRGPTWPNRMYLHSAQSGGRIDNSFPEDLVSGFTWPTIYDRLDDAGIDWATYFGDLSFLLLWGRLGQQTSRIRGFENFLDDARSGRLPAVCHIEPTFFGSAGNDDHPPHDFVRGQAFLSSIIHAIAEGPQWPRAMIVIMYDEHGGFFDHSPPPTVADERADEGFGQLGVRVPGLVLSPWTRRGHVSSSVHEHASVPAFIEWLFGLEPLGLRDGTANSFLDTFDTGRIRRGDPRAFPALPVIELDPNVTPECAALGQTGGGVELAAFADVAQVDASLDRRTQSPHLLRHIYRELIDLGAARPISRR